MDKCGRLWILRHLRSRCPLATSKSTPTHSTSHPLEFPQPQLSGTRSLSLGRGVFSPNSQNYILNNHTNHRLLNYPASTQTSCVGLGAGVAVRGVSSSPLNSSSDKKSPDASNVTATQSDGADESVKVTENCAKRLSELIGREGGGDKFLRVWVEGGGCSGFQYKFDIDNKLTDDDKTFAHPSFPLALVAVDSTSLEYLKGSTIDFEVELIRSAFRVLQNPKAEHGCSCGASFTIKID